MPTNTELPKATNGSDPYRNFKFRIQLDGQHVAGVSKVSALTRTNERASYRSGGGQSTPHRMPGQSEYPAVTLERGVKHEAGFAQWVNQTWDDRPGVTGNQGISLMGFRKDLFLEIYNEAGQKVISYKIYRCWPSECDAFTELDAEGSAAAIQMLKFGNEGWDSETSGIGEEKL
jgi:phage tail-like protein